MLVAEAVEQLLGELEDQVLAAMEVPVQRGRQLLLQIEVAAAVAAAMDPAMDPVETEVLEL
jgi:hypothetical protein